MEYLWLVLAFIFGGLAMLFLIGLLQAGTRADEMTAELMIEELNKKIKQLEFEKYFYQRNLEYTEAAIRKVDGDGKI